jgi:hypothetical protein
MLAQLPVADITTAFTQQTTYVLGLAGAVLGAIVFRHSLSAGYQWASRIIGKAAKPVKSS